MTTIPAPRRERRASTIAERRAQRERERARAGKSGATARKLAFGGLVVAVLAVGAALAFGDFLDRPTTDSGAIDVQSSMAGFTPSVITVKAGAQVALHWWTDDAAIHLQGGVHTMVSDELGLREELAAESERTVSWTAPNRPGTYDVWCDTCCGGKDSPTMHGKIVIEPANEA